MSNKIVNIDTETLLEHFKEEFPVLRIYNDDLEKPIDTDLKRKLTQKEKLKIVDTYFARYFIEFFRDKKPLTEHFLFGKMILLKKDEKPHIHWYENGFEKFNSTLNNSFENVESNIIFNLIENYKKLHDVDALQDFKVFKNNNQ